uniref:N-acetylglucosaminylphosphatidylinositol deacetylase n=1 Tax=Hirondellea gigas TaxID=1518452 RepID=A0A6A7G3D8_9CRUS
MESLLAVLCVGVGLTLSLLTLKPRHRAPAWPPLHTNSNTCTDNKNCGDEVGSSTEQQQQQPCDVAKDLQELAAAAASTTIKETAEENEITAAEEKTIAADTVPSVMPNNKQTGEPDTEFSTFLNNEVETNAANKEYVNVAADMSEDAAGARAMSSKSTECSTTRQRRVLFVIAHPDDECMFFGPTILHFTQKEKAMVFLICLTNGSYNNAEIGRRRQRELWESCQLLGIPASHITLYKCEHLPDHPSKIWPVVNTANIINNHLHTLLCDMVITFDAGGVSGHINHRALHSSLCYLMEEQLLPPDCHVYTLDSVNVVRKYSSLMDLPYSLLFSSYVITLDTSQYCTIRSAMRAHASQYVWFRKMYMVFSRYVMINTLTAMIPSDLPHSAW